MTKDGWRELVMGAVERMRQGDLGSLELLVDLLAQQDAAKHVLMERYSCTGRPWPEIVQDIARHVEDCVEFYAYSVER